MLLCTSKIEIVIIENCALLLVENFVLSLAMITARWL